MPRTSTAEGLKTGPARALVTVPLTEDGDAISDTLFALPAPMRRRSMGIRREEAQVRGTERVILYLCDQ